MDLVQYEFDNHGVAGAARIAQFERAASAFPSDPFQIAVSRNHVQDQRIAFTAFSAQHQQAGMSQQFWRDQQGKQLAQQFFVQLRHRLHDVANLDDSWYASHR
jgi:hypothetical protein